VVTHATASTPSVTSHPAATTPAQLTTKAGNDVNRPTPPAKTVSSDTHSISGVSGGLPDVQQTDQQP
jgi:hypothetical protein